MRKSFASFTIVFLLAGIVLPASRSWGWIDCGHRVVALVAWEDLTSKTKAAVTALLKEHHRFKEDLQEGMPADLPAAEADRYVFAKAATWPDMVRSPANPMSTLYSHPSWHYLDIPIVMDGVTPPPDKNNDGPAPHNVVEAINQSKAQVVDDTVTAENRAVALCWIEHCIGDIHQPLHCVSLFSKEFPDGDRGGNSAILLRDPPYPNSRMDLHLMWDSMPGDYMNGSIDEYMAAGIRNDPRFSREKLKDLLTITDAMAWAHEGHDLAWKAVYLQGQLHAGVNHAKAARGEKAPPIPGVPPGYIANSEVVAMHQVALGGYRLADCLNAIFDAKP